MDVEVRQGVALQRAMDRWWAGRTAAIETGAGTGGRFTPADAGLVITLSSAARRLRVEALHAALVRWARGTCRPIPGWDTDRLRTYTDLSRCTTPATEG